MRNGHDLDDVEIVPTTSGVYKLTRRTAWHTKIQWVVVGGFVVGLGSFVTYGLNKIDVVNAAMAQAAAQTASTARQTHSLEQQVLAIDAGMRSAIERLERKIDANDEKQERRFEQVQKTMVEVLREVKKR